MCLLFRVEHLRVILDRCADLLFRGLAGRENFVVVDGDDKSEDLCVAALRLLARVLHRALGRSRDDRFVRKARGHRGGRLELQGLDVRRVLAHHVEHHVLAERLASFFHRLLAGNDVLVEVQREDVMALQVAARRQLAGRSVVSS